MTPAGVGDSLEFISTLPADRRQQRVALGVLLGGTVAFVAIAPFAHVQVRPVLAFIPAYESALFINDLMTAVLLFGQVAILGSFALLVLASGYLLTALLAVAHALSFPGLFWDTGLFGSGGHTTTWLYVFWRAAFALSVLAYVSTKARQQAPAPLRPALLAGSIAAVAVAAVALTLLAIAGRDWLPWILPEGDYAPAMPAVVSALLLLNGAALVAVWRQRARSTLDLLLAIVMGACLLDIALSAALNQGGFDLAYYGGRLCGILAASFLLIVLLIENSRLYARLVKAHERERGRSIELLEANRELDAANQELDAFCSSVSHDLRAPLRGVDGCASILADDYGERLGAEGNRLLQTMRAECRRMGQLIDDLLAFSRFGRRPLNTQPVPLNALVSAILVDLAPTYEARSIRFTVGDLGTADADAAMLREALVNLLGNAIKFTRRTEQPAIEVGWLREPGFDGPIYFVKDNGAGFDPRHAHKLFQVFERLHRQDEYEGTGVGLAIVQRIIERHGGRVWGDSEPDLGATFYFTLKPGLP
jgi:two-component system sensor histidine kinase/response regulator